jgi:hypothetical protein
LINTEEDIEELLQAGVISEQEYTDALELFRNKVDLNSHQVFQLLKLPWVNPYLIEKLFQYIKREGELKSLEELLKLPFVSKSDYLGIKPFLVITPQRLFSYRAAFDFTKESQEQNLSTRLSLAYKKHLRAKVSYYRSFQKRREKFSKFIRYQNKGVLREFIVGDYFTRFSQRLVLGEKLSGFLAKLNWRNFTLTLVSDVLNNPTSGLLGVNFCVHFGSRLSIEVTTYQEGDRIVGGVGFKGEFDDVEIGAEVAKLKEGGYGIIGVVKSKFKKTSVLLSARDYTPEFNNPHSFGFSQPDGEDNDTDERGIYIELRHKILNTLFLQACLDQWENPSLTETDIETLLKLSWNIFPNFTLSGSRQYQDKDIELTGRDENMTTGEFIKNTFRIFYHFRQIFKITSLVNYIEKDVAKYEEERQSDFNFKVAFEYKLLPQLFLKGGYFWQDTDLKARSNQRQCYWLELKHFITQNLSLRLGYINNQGEEKFKFHLSLSNTF